MRDELREEIENFVEVYIRCPLDELTKRDTKGLYLKALRGEIANFTGVSDPYEEPAQPELVVDTDRTTEKESVERLIDVLGGLGLINRAPAATDQQPV